MGLFARMNTSMDGQRRSLDKLLFASWMVTDVRPNTTVNPFCYHHVISVPQSTVIFKTNAYHDEQDHSCVRNLCYKFGKRRLCFLRYQVRDLLRCSAHHSSQESIARWSSLGSKLDTRSQALASDAEAGMVIDTACFAYLA